MMKKEKMGAGMPITDLEQRRMLGKHLNFGAAEAYKLLRTNLEFSLPRREGGRCPVVGITSSLRGEGKSITSINLGYTIAQSGKRVLLIECDLRLPNVGKRLGVAIKPGLSNVMVGQAEASEAIQCAALTEHYFVLTAGDIPPNPSELLGSDRMAEMVRQLSEQYDYIILDLPPVSAVSDALVVSKLLDGMLVVIRQDYCTRRDLAETVRQLKFSGSKILGFVMTGKDVRKKSYGRYGRYGRYGKYGKYGYGYGNAPSGKTAIPDGGPAPAGTHKKGS